MNQRTTSLPALSEAPRQAEKMPASQSPHTRFWRLRVATAFFMTAALLVLPCLRGEDALQAQIVPSSFFTETPVAPLSTQGPVLTNCDMRQDGNNGAIHAVVWSDNNNSDSWLYVRDWAGGMVTIYFPGTVDPDVALVSGLLPSGSVGTQALVVYRQNDTAYLDIYDLNNIGSGLTVTSALSITTPTPSASLIKLGHASTPPHVDAAYDPTFTPGSNRDMHEFVCAWEDAGTIWYYWNDILNPVLNPPSSIPSLSTAHFSDVAFYTQAGSGGSTRFISLPYLNTASGDLEVVELDPVTGGPTTGYTLYTGGNAYAPRIAALDEWTRGNARWEVASSVQTGSGSREVFGFNLLAGATNMSGILSFLYGPPPAYETMGACVTAGIGLNSGTQPILATRNTR